ncbi:MAG TPA: ribosome maturation factor RimP [Vicinamibacteria bacterium]|nr:ribosome maturation factor RimP [Vicinamibacteria bacterium]
MEPKLKEDSAIDGIRAVAERVTAGRGFELVDVEIRREKGVQLLRLFVDAEGGIGLAELQSVSEEVSAILDAEDPIAASYTLEVSSPGLDRPLKKASDYAKSVGKLVKVASYELVDGRRHWMGRLTAFDEGVLSVTLPKEADKVARIPMDKISHARLEVEFGRQE